MVVQGSSWTNPRAIHETVTGTMQFVTFTVSNCATEPVSFFPLYIYSKEESKKVAQVGMLNPHALNGLPRWTSPLKIHERSAVSSA